MKAGKLGWGLLAVHVLGAVALGLLLGRPVSRPVSHPILTLTEQTEVMPRPHFSDPLEVNRADPKRMILYSDRDLRRREAQEILERLSKALASGRFTSPPRRQWLQ